MRPVFHPRGGATRTLLLAAFLASLASVASGRGASSAAAVPAAAPPPARDLNDGPSTRAADDDAAAAAQRRAALGSAASPPSSLSLAAADTLSIGGRVRPERASSSCGERDACGGEPASPPSLPSPAAAAAAAAVAPSDAPRFPTPSATVTPALSSIPTYTIVATPSVLPGETAPQPDHTLMVVGAATVVCAGLAIATSGLFRYKAAAAAAAAARTRTHRGKGSPASSATALALAVGEQELPAAQHLVVPAASDADTAADTQRRGGSVLLVPVWSGVARWKKEGSVVAAAASSLGGSAASLPDELAEPLLLSIGDDDGTEGGREEGGEGEVEVEGEGRTSGAPSPSSPNTRRGAYRGTLSSPALSTATSSARGTPLSAGADPRSSPSMI
jgi:hypothetical protein